MTNRLADLRRAANAWRRCELTYSIKGWARGDYALDIGYSHPAPEVTASLTRVGFNRITRRLLAEPDIYRPRTFLYLDEFAFFGRLESLVPTLALARAKGISAALLVQDEGFQREVYGPNLTQAISGLCSKFFFRLSDPDTAEKASRHCGEVERIRVTESMSLATSGERPSTTYSMSEHFDRARALPPDYFMSIPLLNPPHINACGYVAASPFLGVYVDDVPLEVMQGWLPRPRLSLPELKAATALALPPPVESSVETSQAEVLDDTLDDEWPDLDSDNEGWPDEAEGGLPDDGLPYR